MSSKGEVLLTDVWPTSEEGASQTTPDCKELQPSRSKSKSKRPQEADDDAEDGNARLKESLKADLSEAEERGKAAKSDATQYASIYLAFIGFILSFVSTATKLGCNEQWVPIVLLTAVQLVAAPLIFVSLAEYSHQSRRFAAFEKKFNRLRTVNVRDDAFDELVDKAALKSTPWMAGGLVFATFILYGAMIFGSRSILC